METSVELLALSDWRRRTMELYAQVRSIAATDPAAAWNIWRHSRESMYREHPCSPLPPDRRASFAASHFTYDPGLRFELPVLAASGATRDPGPSAPAGPKLSPGPARLAAPIASLLPISVGNQIAFDVVGYLEVPFPAGTQRLTLFWLPEYSGGLFLPFRDATNGAETYGGGRYLVDSAKGADLGGGAGRGTLILDFNFAFQPSCAFDPRWSCPLSPPENRLAVEVRAGERLR
jgi:hypothetical protein